MDLSDKVRSLTTSVGVYLFKNAADQVIYVGKAKNLRARVRNYFATGRAEDAKTGSLLREAVDLETIVVDNEREALALENNLIKRLRPRFNVLLRDDKTYPYIRLTAERWPRVYVTRRLASGGGGASGEKSEGGAGQGGRDAGRDASRDEYFGPFFPASLAHRLTRLIHRYFKIPSCRVDLTRLHPRPCLEYHIHRCLGPCAAGLTNDAEYQRAVARVRLLLSGRRTELLRDLRARRDAAAAEEDFEEAAALRDLLAVVEDLGDRQRISRVEGEDADVFGVYCEGRRAAVNLLHIRRGRMVERREFFWDALPEAAVEATSAETAEDREEAGAEEVVRAAAASEESGGGGEDARAAMLLSALLKQLYLEQSYPPPLILTPIEFEDRDALESALLAGGEEAEAELEAAGAEDDGRAEISAGGKENADGEAEEAGAPEFESGPRRRVRIMAPRRGEKRALLELAARNAAHSFQEHFRGNSAAEAARGEELRRELGLAAAPRRIECFDISHFQGADTVASMVVWEDGAMKKSAYRKYIIRGHDGNDDFLSMREVIRRRYRPERRAETPPPSLTLVDGGLGQMHAAEAALREVGLPDQPLAAIAKREEWLYLARRGSAVGTSPAGGREDESEPLRLGRDSPVLHVIQRIRDEAHRFAVTFHRGRRQRRALHSPLLEADGVGEATARRLLRRFGSLKAVRAASRQELTEASNARVAAAVWERLHRDAAQEREAEVGDRVGGGQRTTADPGPASR